MRKILCFALCLGIILSCSFSVFAASEVDKDVTISALGNGVNISENSKGNSDITTTFIITNKSKFPVHVLYVGYNQTIKFMNYGEPFSYDCNWKTSSNDKIDIKAGKSSKDNFFKSTDIPFIDGFFNANTKATILFNEYASVKSKTDLKVTASTSSKKVFTVTSGEVYIRSHISNGWVKVATTNNKYTGWVPVKNLKY
ncbi:MAG TPA: SH3 domain-containing protein [Ruminiclostridium sp.]|nr:SH3 domain-containing protein [Ruminiclostridium sp.]